MFKSNLWTQVRDTLITTNQFKNGMYIELEGVIYSIQEFQHVKPGKGGAFVRTKLKSVKIGTVLDKTFRAGEKVKQVIVEDKKMRYLYRSSQSLAFMNEESFEEFVLPIARISDLMDFLKEDRVVTFSVCDDKVLAVKLPTFVEFEVIETEPGIRGDTVKLGTKPAILETGVTINVPLFINKGDKIRVDTKRKEYVARA